MNFNKTHICILIILFTELTNSFSQSATLYTKYFVKNDSTLLRWAPSSKELFNLGISNGYKITRQEINSSNPALSITNIYPLQKTDTSKWNDLIRKNINAELLYQIIYENKNSNPISEKEKDAQYEMLYGLLLLSCDFDAEFAKAAGLYYSDTALHTNTKYKYTIEINRRNSTDKIISSSFEINTSILSHNPKISNVSGTFKNKTINLKWKTSEFTSHYGGYNIERSTDNKNFNKINSAPVILTSSQFEKKKEHITYTDTVPETDVVYYYRIRGINHFGEESAPSNTVSGTGYEELRSSPLIDSLKVIDNRKVYLHWKMGDQRENVLPKEYILLRSDKDQGTYTLIYRSSNEFEFTDNTPNQSNYYKIGAVTKGNDTLISFSKLALIIDTIPPIAPANIHAKVDSKGNVQIIWDKNPENDIQGYKIYKANALTEEFVQINNEFAKTTFYRDKLNLKTLSKKIYYSVAATDNNYNTSHLSKPIEVKRPDTIPPVPAIIKELIITENGIRTTWIPSNSEDVKQYILYHQDEKTRSDVKIRSWGPSDTSTSYTDTLVEFGSGYRYKIIVMDEDDNISVSNDPYMFFETGFRKKIQDISHRVDREKKCIILNWNYPENEIEKYIVYRAKPSEQLTILKTLAHPSSGFTDNTLNIGNLYEYRIKAVFKNGAESIISDAIKVEY